MPRKKQSLTPEELEAKRIAQNKRTNEWKKAHGWVHQKKYQQAHKDDYYSPKIKVPSENKQALKQLLANTNKTLSELFFELVEEKYGIILSKKGIDSNK